MWSIFCSRLGRIVDIFFTRNEKYFSEVQDLSFIHVDSVTNLGISSENDYKLYKIKASSSTSKHLDFREIFYKGDYFTLKATPLEFPARVYKILNEDTIEIEILNNSTLPIILTGNIIGNINILYSPYIYNIENKDYIILKIKEVKLINSLTNSFFC